MSFSQYTRRIIFLPLLVPVLVLIWDSYELPFPGGFELYLFMSFLVGGIPYFLFAWAYATWTLGRQERTVKISTLFTPLVFAVICVSGIALFEQDFSLDTAIFLGGPCLFLGYIYVAMGWVIWWIIAGLQRYRNR